MQTIKQLVTLGTIQTLIRAVLKVGGGYLLAKGLADENAIEALTAGALALAGILWGVFHRDGKAVPPAAMLIVALLALGAAGCASFNAQAFYAEKLATDTAYASLSGWKSYYAIAITNVQPAERAALSNRNDQVYAASRTFAAAMGAADALRETCATNAAASNRNGFFIALEVARGHASNLVWLVKTFPR